MVRLTFQLLFPTTNNKIVFLGLLTRADAEQRLMQETAGTFLVRVSEKIWGYAISYKDVDRCKHYLVDASNSKYQFLGANQFSHESLGKYLFNCYENFLFNLIFFFISRSHTIPFFNTNNKCWK